MGGGVTLYMNQDKDHSRIKEMQNGKVMRPYKELRRAKKLNEKGKRKTIHIGMHSPKEYKGEIKPPSVINVNK